MSHEKTVEQRLTCLEDTVADLQRRVAALFPEAIGWSKLGP